MHNFIPDDRTHSARLVRSGSLDNASWKMRLPAHTKTATEMGYGHSHADCGTHEVDCRIDHVLTSDVDPGIGPLFELRSQRFTLDSSRHDVKSVDET